jgi:hypothetical protein
MQYGIGLNGWSIVLIRRMLLYGRLFEPRFRNMTPLKRAALEWSVSFSLSIFVLGVCLGATFSSGVHYVPEMRTCHSNVEWKALILGWVVMVCVTFGILNALVIKKVYQEGVMSEYQPIRSIIFFGLVVIIVKSPVHFLGMTGHAYGRFIDTTSVIVLHLYAFFRITWYSLYMAITRDKNYSDRMRENIVESFPEISSVQELAGSKVIMDAFLEHCRTQPKYSILIGKRQITIEPGNVVEAYRSMLAWKQDYDIFRDKITLVVSQEKKEILKTSAKEITDKYLHSGGSAYCGIAPNSCMNVRSSIMRLDEDIFDTPIASLFNEMDRRWGSVFLEKSTTDRVYGATPAAINMNLIAYRKQFGRDSALDTDDFPKQSLLMSSVRSTPDRSGGMDTISEMEGSLELQDRTGDTAVRGGNFGRSFLSDFKSFIRRIYG